MPHFFIPPQNLNGKTFRITGEDVHYLSNVRRYGVGDKIKIFDGKGMTLLGVINSISKDEIKGAILKCADAEKPLANIHLYQAVPKGERFDWLVEKAAEIGVLKLTPIITERSAFKEVPEPKLERCRRLSKAACQQCGRALMMEIEKPLHFNDAIDSVKPGSMKIIPWESENTKTLKEVFEKHKNREEINIFIGPEGGFSVTEIEFACGRGAITVTLGERILRSETAGLVSSILALNFCGEYEKK